MTAQTILILYLIFFVLKLGWETFLDLLNSGHVKKNREKMPAFIRGFMEEGEYKKSVDYTLTKQRFSLISGFFSGAFVLLIILPLFEGVSLLGFMDRWINTFSLGPYFHGILFIFTVTIIFQIYSIPFSLYSQFVIEKKFGFNKMTLKLFFADIAKGLILSAILGIPLLLALFWFMDQTGELWWLWAFALYALFQAFIMVIYPTVIAPIFNKFTPMEEGELKEQINTLADKLNFKTNGIFMMDGSRRSKHSNAYFTGIGKVKRIVLFDTLINTLKSNQLLGVLAHEIGHEKKGHTKKMLFWSLASMLLGFFVLSLLLKFPPLFEAFGFGAPAYHTVLILLAFCSGPFTFFLSPLSSILSRKYEYEADRFAVKGTGNPEDIKGALLNLSTTNLSNLTPHPLYSFFYYSHPTVAERIAAVDKIKA